MGESAVGKEILAIVPEITAEPPSVQNELSLIEYTNKDLPKNDNSTTTMTKAMYEFYFHLLNNIILKHQ